MSDLLELLSVCAASMVKFAVAPFLSYGLDRSFVETLITTSVGGCIGVVVFYRLSGWFMKRARLKRLHREIAIQHGVVVERQKVFTRTNRFIVRIKHGWGLKGLAALTPIVLSIPIGSIIAAKYFRHDRRTIPVMLSSVLIWSVVLSSFWTVVK
jgi:hypothetical protein